MPGSFRVGRLFGIEIRLHVSWLIIFALVFYGLWQGQFEGTAWSQQKRLIVAVVTALLFFCSIIAHELSHSLVARRFKMKVSSITLFLLGGVANLTQEPPTARAEFFMAAAGPAMSLVIGIIGLALGGGQIPFVSITVPGILDIGAAPSLDGVIAVASYIGTINLALAVFNLLPGFPLDGGRVLRSIIWAVRGDRAKATPIAARGGQLVAGLFVLWGVTQFTEGDSLWFWPLLLAYFLYNAATQSMRQERIGGLVAGTHVAPLMNTTFVPADPRATVAAVVRDIMLPRNLRAVPVVADQSFLGLMTTDDVRRLDHERWTTTPIEQVMTPSASLATLAPEDDLGQALARFGDAAVLPVVRDGRLVGLLDRDGVVSYIRMRDQFTHGR
ncbi:MAG TPA: site-2 protease family protein [Candidatus Limnocylindria bacterium]|nr:site-2 protease family protein [Candidatus Limnocylindria bacterium]